MKVNGKNNRIHTNHGGNTEFVQTTTDQTAINVQDKLIVENAPSISLPTAIKAASGSSP